MIDTLQQVDGVRKVHNLRVWALTLDKVAVSAHLAVDATANAQYVLREASHTLEKSFGVFESTIQIEIYDENDDDCAKCEPVIV